MADWWVHTFRLTACGANVVYVGVSFHRPAERLKQHQMGYKSSRQVRRGRPELAEELYEHLSPYERRYLADAAADELAAELVEFGYDVRADPNRLQRISNTLRPAPAVISLEAAATRRRITRAAGQPFIDRYAA
jgi:hypothetical protein